MPSVEIRIPQLGEGLQEARLVRFLKQPGERIASDEPIYEMETDKAVMEIEAPAAGVLVEWLAAEDEVLPIGAVVGRVETGDGSGPSIPPPERPQSGSPPSPVAAPSAEGGAPALRNAAVPPRTRAYARERGVDEAELARLAQQSGGKVMPEDIDRYLASRGRPGPGPAAVVAAQDEYEDAPLPAQQRTLVFRMQRSAQLVVPASMEMPVEWSGIEWARESYRERGEAEAAQPSHFTLFAWCAVQAARDHPSIRSAVVGDHTVRRYAHLHLGIAVSRPGDELLMARVPYADTLEVETFIARARDAISRARVGDDQSSDAMQLILTSMSGAGIRRGIPVNVAPAAATLFLGEPYHEAYPEPGGGIGLRRVAVMTLTFDHRLMNGVGAAAYLTDVRTRVESIRADLAGSL